MSEKILRGRPSGRPKDKDGSPVVIDWNVETPATLMEKYGTPYSTACLWRRKDTGNQKPGPKAKTNE